MFVAKRSHGDWRMGLGWLQTHKWFYRREVNKNRGRRRGGWWLESTWAGVIWGKAGGGWWGVKGWWSQGSERVLEVGGWIPVSGEVNQSFLDFRDFWEMKSSEGRLRNENEKVTCGSEKSERKWSEKVPEVEVCGSECQSFLGSPQWQPPPSFQPFHCFTRRKRTDPTLQFNVLDFQLNCATSHCWEPKLLTCKSNAGAGLSLSRRETTNSFGERFENTHFEFEFIEH